jgi:hypothetical protein
MLVDMLVDMKVSKMVERWVFLKAEKDKQKVDLMADSMVS